MANAPIPEFQDNVTTQVGSTPEFQSSFEKFGESTTNLGAIGAKVAQSASNQMATQLGYETGKNPQGDLLPPLTDFDKSFTDSYHQQAAATLSLQGQKLLDDAELEMSKPSRLSPELISKTHTQLQLGLNKIAANAPTAIKGKLEEAFSSQILDQTTKYKQKMITQQREDQKNTLINGLDLNTKNALELATSGDFKGADAAVESSKKMATSGRNSSFLTPEQARVAHESTTQAALDGKYTFLAKEALNQGKYAEFERHYSENKPEGMTNEQYISTGQAFSRQVGFLQSLRVQDENLKSQNMLNQIAIDPSSITGTQWQSYVESVTPLKAAQVQFKYIQAIKAHQNSSASVDGLISNFSNPETWANSTPKIKNAAYLKSVDYTVQQSQNSTNPLTHDQAEVQVAAAAGGTVPVFINGIKNKLHTGNPAFIESAAQQIKSLEQMDAGHALVGLNDQDKALYTTYEALRDSRDPITAARDATATILNQDPAVQDANKQKWSNLLRAATSGGGSITKFALNTFSLKENDFINPSMAQVYGTDILEKYKSLYQISNGDNNVAKNLTQKYITDNYGQTGVNGGNALTLHPLEKVLGFKDSGAVPYIQQDVIDQMTQKLVPIKKMYDDNKSNEYWEILPLSGKKHGVISSSYDPIQIKRHMRTNAGEKTDSYNVVLHGNSFNWDVAIQNKDGMRNLFQTAPYLGILNYTPNSKSIYENYNKNNSISSPSESFVEKSKKAVGNLAEKTKSVFENPEHPNKSLLGNLSK